MKEQKPELKIYNNTPFTLELVKTWPVIGRMRNEWRQRNVTVYAHPTDESRVISIGESFDGKNLNVCDEPKDGFTNTIADFPRTHVYR